MFQWNRIENSHVERELTSQMHLCKQKCIFLESENFTYESQTQEDLVVMQVSLKQKKMHYSTTLNVQYSSS